MVQPQGLMGITAGPAPPMKNWVPLTPECDTPRDLIFEHTAACPREQPEPPPGSRSEALFLRIKAGDREAAAEFVLLFGAQIRRRIRGKMGRRLRRLFDTQDIVSTLLRRLDVFLLNHDLRASTDGQMWSLVARITETAILEKGRLMQRLKRRDDDPTFRRSLGERLGPAEGSDFDLQMSEVFEHVHNPMDRQLLWMWLAGHEHEASAQALGLSPAAVRKRWERLKERLKGQLLGHAA